MHKRFVLDQLREIAVGERRVGPQADVAGAGQRLRREVRHHLHRRRDVPEVTCEHHTHALGQFVRREVLQIAAVHGDVQIGECAEHRVERAREIERPHIAPEEFALGRAEQFQRVLEEIRGADRAQHLGRRLDHPRHAPEPVMHGPGSVGQGPGRSHTLAHRGDVQRGIGDLGKLLRALGEKPFRHLRPPGNRPQDPDRPLRLAQQNGGLAQLVDFCEGKAFRCRREGDIGGHCAVSTHGR